MFEIAICDDDSAFAADFCTRLDGVLDERSTPHRISQFSNPSALLEAIESGQNFDLIFQDVLFGVEKGIRFAKLLRANRWKIDVVFVTSSRDYALEGYDANPLHYLVKPVTREQLASAVDRFLAKHTPQFLRLTTARGLLQLQLSEVLYFEIYDHDIVIHETNGAREACTGTLKELEAMLPPRSFVRPHRSYLVNLEHVSKIVCYQMQLSSGDVIPISRGLYPQVQRSLIDYADRTFPSL